MSASIFLAIKAVISLVTGLSFLLLPGYVLPLYGVTINDSGLFFNRLFSAMAIGIGGICWLIRGMEGEARRAVMLSLFVADTIGLVVTLIAQLQGLINYLGWINVALWAFLVAGLGYFRFIKKS